MVILFIFFVLFFPLLLLLLEKKSRLITTLSPIIICYGAGLLLANQHILEVPTKIATTLSEVAVPLSIPLLLISTHFKAWLHSVRGAVTSFLLSLLAVTIMATLGAYFFQNDLPNTWKLAGMVSGVYSGGTPNMSAIGLSLEVPEETFILLNASDLVWGALYLLFLMTLAKPLLSTFLKKSHVDNTANTPEQSFSFASLKTSEKLKNLTLFWLIGLGLLGAAVGLAMMTTGKMHPIVVILLVTTGGIGLSFTALRTIPGSYALGDYFLLVFCLSLGTLADVSQLVQSAADTLLFTGFVMFGAILLHLLFAYWAKIDRDTVIITSVAGIYGPAFVGPVAKILNNKSVILTGMTTGLIGYAIGNYLGIGLAMILKYGF